MRHSILTLVYSAFLVSTGSAMVSLLLVEGGILVLKCR